MMGDIEFDVFQDSMPSNEPNPEELIMFVDGIRKMSGGAQLIVNLILEMPPTFFAYVYGYRRKKNGTTLNDIKFYFGKCGVKGYRVEAWFREITRFLQ